VGRRYGWVPGFLLDLLDLYANRDGCRTPMQWDDGENAGFCGKGVTPWLPVHQNHKSINVKTELADEDSLLNVYRALLRLRGESTAIQEGTIQLIDNPDMGKNLLAYRRDRDDEAVLVLINFGARPSVFQNPTACKRPLLTIGLDTPGHSDKIALPPYSGLILGN
jgi:glycosidase